MSNSSGVRPLIKPGTALIASEEILGYMGDYPTSYGINTMYHLPGAGNVPLWFFALSENFNLASNPDTGQAELNAQRGLVTFRGKPEDAIYISYEPENKECLWILRPQDAEYKNLPETLNKAALSSNYENIQSRSPSPVFTIRSYPRTRTPGVTFTKKRILPGNWGIRKWSYHTGSRHRTGTSGRIMDLSTSHSSKLMPGWETGSRPLNLQKAQIKSPRPCTLFSVLPGRISNSTPQLLRRRMHLRIRPMIS